METDSMIDALVNTRKFTLPEGTYIEHGRFYVSPWPNAPWRYDLCAMHFAREAIENDRWDDLIDSHEKLIERWDIMMSEGDAAEAIAALYAVFCA